MITLHDLLKTPSKNDIAWQWVNIALPAENTTAYSQALYVFSAAAVLMTTLWFAWNVVSGIVHTAYTGKVLGERWHQIWAPLRVVLGFGLLVPVAATGLSGVHNLIRDVPARIGINLGNVVWTTFVDTVVSHSVPILPISTGGSAVVMGVLENELCAAVYNRAGDTWGWEIPLPSPTGRAIGDRVFWTYGTTCGQYSLTIPQDRDDFSDARRAAIGAIVEQSRAAANVIADAVTFTSGVGSSDAYTAAVSAKLLDSDLIQKIRAAGAAYDAAIVAAAKASVSGVASDERKKLSESAKEQGWVAAGMYWRGLAKISELTTSLTNEKPERQAPRTNSDFAEPIQRGFEALRLQIAGEANRTQMTANDFAAAGDEQSDFLTKALAPLTRSMAEWATTPETDETKDAMGSIIASGHVKIVAAETAVVVGGGVAVGASNWFAEKLGAHAAADWYLGWASGVIGITWLVGMLQAYVIPVLPMIYVFMSGVLFAVAIVEASIAGVVWCMGFVRMDGHDFIEQAQATGVRILFDIMLRPALTVLVLCGGFFFFEASIRTFRELWGVGYWAQQGGHLAGISGMIGSMVLRAYVEWMLSTKGFGLMSSIVERVGNWFGRQTPGMGDSEHAVAAVMGATAVANRATPGALPAKALSKAKPTTNIDK